MSRAVIFEEFGTSEVLQVRNVPEPHADSGEVRVKVAAFGLNPMDWIFASMPEMATQFGITVPSGFGHDFAGVVDEVGTGVNGFALGERVYGGAQSQAAADYVVLDASSPMLFKTPDAVNDLVASTLYVPVATASAALDVIDVRTGDVVLIGGAAGGVGVIAVQLAKLLGASVIGTASRGTFEFLRELGAQPVEYGLGLEDRVRELAPDGITAAADLFGTEAAEAALALGVAPGRISTIAAGPKPPGGVRATGGVDAPADAMQRVSGAIADGRISVPVAATFPLENVREAVDLQAGRHVHGKVVVIL